MATNFNRQVYANNATTSLSYAIDQFSTVIGLVDGSLFPTTGDNEYFTVTIGSGSDFEIVEVYSRVGDVLHQCVRGAQGTSPRSFPAGALVENRLTAGTLSSFARIQDKLADVNSIEELSKPEYISDSCLLNDTDDGGNPVVAVEYSGRWRFITHPIQVLDQALYDPLNQITPTSFIYSSTADLSSVMVRGSLIIQAISGQNRGVCRFISAATASQLTWVAPFPYSFSYGDRVQVYQSTTSYMRWLAQQVSLLSGSQSTSSATIRDEISKTSYKAPAVVSTTVPITLSGVQTVDGVLVQSGDRVLVKDQTLASQNGIYVVSTGGWSRSTDADDNTKVRSGILVPVTGGTINHDTLWSLDVTDPVTVGTTALTFINTQSGLAPITSPVFAGIPSGPTAPTDTNTTQLATTEFVIGQSASSAPEMNGFASPGTSRRWSRSDHVHPSDVTRAPLASPAFSGSPTVPTAPTLDSSYLIANTEFVQRARGSLAGLVSYSGNTTLTSSDIGKLVVMSSTGASQTVYLPEIANLASGATITIRAAGTHCITVSSTMQNGDWIAVDSRVAYDSYQQKAYLMPGESIALVLHKTGLTGGYPAAVTGLWYAISGDLLSQNPVGSIRHSATPVVPFGYLLADGSTVSRSVYARLFSVIGTTFGLGDGTSTFRLPDLRGEFIRGLDLGRGVDPNRALGSFQEDSLKSHAHSILARSGNYSGNASVESNDGLGTQSSYTTSSVGGSETRPRNIALATVIKY